MFLADNETPLHGEPGEEGATYDNPAAAQAQAAQSQVVQGYEAPNGAVTYYNPSGAVVAYAQQPSMPTQIPTAVARLPVSGVKPVVRPAAGVSASGIAGIPWKTILIVGGVALVGWWLLMRGRKGKHSRR